MRKIDLLIISSLLMVSIGSFGYAYAVDNNCLTNINFIFQAQVSLGCFDERIDALENAETSNGSESTECINLASQYQIILNSTNGNCYVRSLANGTGITMVTNSTHIIINSTSGGCTDLECLEDVFLFSPVSFDAFVYDASNNVWTNINPILFDGIVSNISPNGEGIWSDRIFIDGLGAEPDRNEDRLKSLLSGSGISLSSNSTHITITNISTGICTNTGTGEAICENSGTANNINSLISGTGISITDTTGDLTIENTQPSVRIAQVAGDVYFSLAKTNIGTAYVDIYVTAFDEENQMIIDCANVTYGKVVYIWDYVGTGNQQLRWVDVSNNANIFYESPIFTTDRDATDSGFFVKPSWCLGTVTIEQQGKSTVGTDDPVAKGYKIVVK